MELGNFAPAFTAAGRRDDPAVVAAKERFYRFGWGLFIHYGLFSASGEGEWQMHDERIDPKAYYAERLPLFKPKPGCIDEWIALAKDAGMLYVCLTTRHHEGFWLGDGFLRRLQPGLLITRCQDDDLMSCEQNSAGGAGLWESCYTLNGSWGYFKHDPCWKSAADVVKMLISIRARGGTMLMNVGPMADGSVPPEAAGRLREIGAWVKANAAAFYDVKPDPFDGACYEWMTQDGRDPQKVYFQFIRSWNDTRYLCGIGNRVKRVFFVDTGEDLPFEQDPETGIVSIHGHPYATRGDVPRMAGVEFESKPRPVYDPCMPVNMAEALAAARIPILLLYGGQDATVPPAKNGEPFADRFRAAGGAIAVEKRNLFGHHPHGLDPDKTATITNFFTKG